MSRGLEVGFLLDRRWHALRGEMERTKRSALVLLARVMTEARVPYAIIGGLALQLRQADPRTTLDIDVAVSAASVIPRSQLQEAGFRMTGRFAHPESWLGPEETPVQFTDDPLLAEAVARAEDVQLDGVSIRVIRRADLLHEKLRAAADPARRRSKRLQDFADAQALLETAPDLARELTPEEQTLLNRLPS
jgi:Nucleotidyl transferase AbiEii toxin, Type IV TA system